MYSNGKSTCSGGLVDSQLGLYVCLLSTSQLNAYDSRTINISSTQSIVERTQRSVTVVRSHVSLLCSDRLQALITETVVFESNNMKPKVHQSGVSVCR